MGAVLLLGIGGLVGGGSRAHDRGRGRAAPPAARPEKAAQVPRVGASFYVSLNTFPYPCAGAPCEIGPVSPT